MVTVSRRDRLQVAGAFAAFCALVVAIGMVSAAGAEEPKVIGKTQRSPEPACPGDPCSAIGSVTGFQVEANGKKALMKADEDGRLVGFSLDLSKPNKEQRNFFGDFFENDRFGKDPVARIAVIKHLDGKQYRLKRQSPVVNLKDDLGEEHFYTLNDPFQIKQGEILALTVPGWSSSFATGLDADQHKWKASRRKGRCSSASDIKNGRPHQQIGDVRQYGCTYNLDRLLYWGYYIPT
jgi:hypothetical protein